MTANFHFVARKNLEEKNMCVYVSKLVSINTKNEGILQVKPKNGIKQISSKTK